MMISIRTIWRSLIRQFNQKRLRRVYDIVKVRRNGESGILSSHLKRLIFFELTDFWEENYLEIKMFK